MAPGAILVPMQVNKAEGKQEKQVRFQEPLPTNEERAANMLQLSNGFVIGNLAFKLSSRVSEKMSRQSFKQQKGK